MTRDQKIVGIWPAEPIDIATPLANPDSLAVQQPNLDTAAMSDHSRQADVAATGVAPHIEAVESDVSASRMSWIVAIIIVLAGAWALSASWPIVDHGFDPGRPRHWLSMADALLPPLILAAVAFLIDRRLSARATKQQLALLGGMLREHRELEERLAEMQNHWRVADRELQQRAETMAHYGLDTVARLAEAGTELEASMQRCASAAAQLAERGEAAQNQLDSLNLAIPKIEEVTARLSDNLRQAGQSAYQFGGQLEARIASIGAEAASTGSVLADACETLSQRTLAVQTTAADARAALLAGIEHLELAAQQQRDQALVFLAEYAASANETTSQSAADLNAARLQLNAELSTEIDSLRSGAAELEAAALSLHTTLQNASSESDRLSAALEDNIETAEQKLTSIETHFSERFGTLQQALSALNDGVSTFQAQANSGDQQVVGLIQRAETLLIALDSATREIDESVPSALKRLTEYAATAAIAVGQLSPSTDAEIVKLQNIEARLQTISASINDHQQRLNDLISNSDKAASSHNSVLSEIEQQLIDLQSRMANIANGDATTLAARLVSIESEARASIEATEEAIDRLVAAASTRAAADLSSTIERVAGEAVNERLGAVSAHADQAVSAAAAASDRLMRQLITIADSSAALEQRAQEVSHLTAAVGRETLAKQMSLLTEALQSTALDLTKLFDADIADQAWGAYLNGDRSIFTRRAARLLTNSESRDVLRRYENDDVFRSQVNRYIHDFETMLRGVMDTPGGDALSVTLLSSDIGKLYVVLAQAVDRLRH